MNKPVITIMLLLLTMLFACQTPPKEVRDQAEEMHIIYVQDNGLCFAYTYRRRYSRSTAGLAHVPCDKVEHLIRVR